MNNEISYVGPFRLRENSRFHDGFWVSRVNIGGVSRSIVDAAGAMDDGRNDVRLIPYGPTNRELDGVLRDGDLLGYMQGPINLQVDQLASIRPDVVGGIIKGRVSHAEIGYSEPDGRPKQVSLWGQPGPMRPLDRPFHEHACNDAINVYRLSLAGYGIEAEREALLKSEVKRWKRIVQPVYFPVQTMNTDPVDFVTVDELGRISRGFVRHSPSDGRPPFEFRLNCVQWSTLVVSLAVCYPLSRTMLERTDMIADYERNWAAELGFAEEGLVGLDELPIPFYTVAEAVENTVDLYFSDWKAEIVRRVNPAAVAPHLTAHGIGLDRRFVMPAAFMIENRLRAAGVPRKTKSVFEYVATAVPEGELVRIG